MHRIVVYLVLVLSVGASTVLPRAYGIILYSDGTAVGGADDASRVAPTGSIANSGWQWEGNFDYYNATPIAPNWIITASHLGKTAGTSFTLGGTTYTTTEMVQLGATDLRLYKVNGTFSSYAPIYTDSDEQGKSFVVYGRGKPRGAVVTTGSTLNGWLGGNTDHVERWGTNVVSSITNDPFFGGVLNSTFDPSGGQYEAQLASGDSGGGVFINDGGVWKLAGINMSVSGPYSLSSAGNSTFYAAIVNPLGIYDSSSGVWAPTLVNSSSSYSRISSNSGSIASVIGMGIWKPSGSATWSNTNSWYGTAPNAVDATAEFGDAIVTGRTVTIDSPVTVGTLEFNQPTAGYTLAASGTGGLTLDVSAINPSATIRVLQGSHEVSVPLTLSRNTALDVQGTRLTLGGTLNNLQGRTITKTGAGDLVVSATQSHAQGAQFVATSGKTTFNTSGGANLDVTVNSGAQVVLGNGTNHTLDTLTIGSGGTVVGPLGNSRVTVLNGLSMASTAKFDLQDNDLVVRATSTSRSAVVADLAARLAQGAGTGAWDGTSGLTSSLAQANALHLTALAMVLNDTGLGSSLFSTFGGVSVGVNDVLVKYTYYGDANLDGVLNALDYAAWTNGRAQGLTGWWNGDFNYDGFVNGIDLALLDNTYNFFPSIPLSESMLKFTPVPEPATWLTALLGGAGLLLGGRRAIRRRD